MNEVTFFLLDNSEGNVSVLPYSDGAETGADNPSEPASPWGENDNLAVAQITVDDVRQMQADYVNACLFGNFLVCGTLVGCMIFGRLHK